jgi:hypothetical protein
MSGGFSLETSSTLSRHAKSVVLAHLCIGCIGFSLLESWSLADSLYATLFHCHAHHRGFW